MERGEQLPGGDISRRPEDDYGGPAGEHPTRVMRSHFSVGFFDPWGLLYQVVGFGRPWHDTWQDSSMASVGVAGISFSSGAGPSSWRRSTSTRDGQTARDRSVGRSIGRRGLGERESEDQRQEEEQHEYHDEYLSYLH